jgi:hypothetical protein
VDCRKSGLHILETNLLSMGSTKRQRLIVIVKIIVAAYVRSNQVELGRLLCLPRKVFSTIVLSGRSLMLLSLKTLRLHGSNELSGNTQDGLSTYY